MRAIAHAIAADPGNIASVLGDPMLTVSLQTRMAMAVGIVFVTTVKRVSRFSQSWSPRSPALSHRFRQSSHNAALDRKWEVSHDHPRLFCDTAFELSQDAMPSGLLR
jgi:hypothetical protein